ncbi:hypothetical protein PSTEL_07945 [Paenibacillus stellifer]|uniref:Type I restriction modification DNA specificity domain-containing protein n=1 Tax=Paenibacillus stellifer TaxID=169760 RepID=A0A089LUX9_9BACL|nr:restriction endonuclease subunit S [Paenibacillus stellifer]AIQ63043.1 hypothetical protein PSTEL_07945 [Paenibacillus stellifer]
MKITTSTKRVKLGDITNNLDSKRIPLNERERNKMKREGGYPYIGANGVLSYVDKYIFDETILCIAEDGGSWGYNQQCAFIVDERCWVNNHAHVLTAKKDISLKFLMYYLGPVCKL